GVAGGPPGAGGPGGRGGPPQPGQLVPAFLQDVLKLTDDQKKQLGAFQKDADGKLDKLLNDDQKKQFKEPQGFGGLPQPGQFMSPPLEPRLKRPADQKKELQALQKEADALSPKPLTEAQKKRFKTRQASAARGGFGPGGPGGPPGPGGPGGGARP